MDDPLAELPHSSVAVQVIVAVHVCAVTVRSVVIVARPQASVAVALASQAFKASAVPGSPHVTVIGGGTLSAGSVVSTMVNVAESLAEAPQRSVTVHVTVADPVAPQPGTSV